MLWPAGHRAAALTEVLDQVVAGGGALKALRAGRDAGAPGSRIMRLSGAGPVA